MTFFSKSAVGQSYYVVFLSLLNPTFLPVNITHPGGRKSEMISLFSPEDSELLRELQKRDDKRQPCRITS